MDPGQPHATLLPSLTSNVGLLKSGQYSDMTLRCGNDEFHLHCALLCPRSAVLRTWIDSSFLEGQTGLIILPPDNYNAVAVARMIAFIYQGTYDDVRALPPYEIQSWEDPSWELDSAGDDYIPSRMLTNAAVHALADFFNMPDLQAFAKARFRTLTLDFWGTALPHMPKIIRAVFGTQGNDHPDLQGPVLERCVGIYKNITTNTECIEAMDIYPAFSRGLLQFVGRKLEDKAALLTSENEKLTNDIEDLKIAARSHKYEISELQFNLHIILRDLNNKVAPAGREEIDETGNVTLEEQIDSIRLIITYMGAGVGGRKLR